MRLQMLLLSGAFLVALVPCSESRSIGRTPAAALSMSSPPSSHLQFTPFLLRMGEEYFIRLGNIEKYLPPSLSGSRLPGPFSELQLLQKRAEEGEFRAETLSGQQDPYSSPEEAATERAKRTEDPPISLDLTFHLLREVLEMARAEQIAQKAHSNRKLMETAGK